VLEAGCIIAGLFSFFKHKHVSFLKQTHLIDVLCGYHALFAWVPPPLRGLYIEPPTCPTPCRHRVVSGASVASNPNKEELRPDMGGRVVSGSAEHPPVVSSFPINQWLSKVLCVISSTHELPGTEIVGRIDAFIAVMAHTHVIANGPIS